MKLPLVKYCSLTFQMVAQRCARSAELAHLSWFELFSYCWKQAYHLLKGTFTDCLHTWILLEDEPDIAVVETPYGAVYVPASLGVAELRMLVREAFDKSHWHHYESDETHVENDVVVDCGTAEGFWARAIAPKCRKLFLIEPQEVFVRCLEKTFAVEIASGKIKIFRGALGSKNGRVNLALTVAGNIAATVRNSDTGHIPLYRLDSLFDEAEKIDFIKADIEGMEEDMLRGAEEIIKLHRPKIAVTVYHEANNWRQIVEFVRSVQPSYRYRLKGVVAWGKPLMLHMWSEDR